MENRRKVLITRQRKKQSLPQEKLSELSLLSQLKFTPRSIDKNRRYPQSQSLIRNRGFPSDHFVTQNKTKDSCFFPQIRRRNPSRSTKIKSLHKENISSNRFIPSHQKLNSVIDELDIKLRQLELEARADRLFQERYPELLESQHHQVRNNINQPTYQYPLQPYIILPNNALYPMPNPYFSPYQLFQSHLSPPFLQNQNYQHNSLNNSQTNYSIPSKKKMVGPLLGDQQRHKLQKRSLKSRKGLSYNKQKLKKFRRCIWVIMFTKWLPQYAKAIRIKRFLKFKGKEQKNLVREETRKISEKIRIISLFQVYEKLEDKFYNLPDKADFEKLRKDGISVFQKNVQFFVSFDACQSYIKQLIDQIEKIIEKQQLKQSYDFLMHLMNGQFPYHHMFLVEELERVRFHEIYGCLVINKKREVQLLMNYIIIKVLFEEIIFKGQKLSRQMKRASTKNGNSKRKMVLIGKKIKMCLITFYKIINDGFMEPTPQSSNYENLSGKLKVQYRPNYSVVSDSSNNNKGQMIKKGQMVKKGQMIKGMTDIDKINKTILEKGKAHEKRLFKIMEKMRQSIYQTKRRELRIIKKKVLKEGAIVKKIKFRMPAPPQIIEESDDEQSD